MINDQLETVMHLQVLNGGNLSTAYARLQQGKSSSRKKHAHHGQKKGAAVSVLSRT